MSDTDGGVSSAYQTLSILFVVLWDNSWLQSVDVYVSGQFYLFSVIYLFI